MRRKREKRENGEEGREGEGTREESGKGIINTMIQG